MRPVRPRRAAAQAAIARASQGERVVGRVVNPAKARGDVTRAGAQLAQLDAHEPLDEAAHLRSAEEVPHDAEGRHAVERLAVPHRETAERDRDESPRVLRRPRGCDRLGAVQRERRRRRGKQDRSAEPEDRELLGYLEGFDERHSRGEPTAPAPGGASAVGPDRAELPRAPAQTSCRCSRSRSRDRPRKGWQRARKPSRTTHCSAGTRRANNAGRASRADATLSS